MKIAAFFDMDRTLLRCNTGSEWVRFLRRRKEISTLDAVRAALWIFRYKLSILDMEAVTERLTATMTGQSEAELVEKCREFVEQTVFPAIAPSAFEAVEEHRSKKHVLAILSTSTPYITEPLAARLGIEHVLCTRLDIVDGKFAGTHRKPACYGAGKVHWAERFAGEHGVDLAASFFYTDSYSDLPMLQRVGEKRVINPDGRLARHARRAGWPVALW